jgi:phage terminase large subunit
MFYETTATKKIKRMTFKQHVEGTTTFVPPKRIHGVPGGTSASKTISILMFLIAKAQSDWDKKTKTKLPTLTSVVSESIPHLKRGVIRDFKKILQEQGYWNDQFWNGTDFIYTFETGSQIEFFSADNGEKVRGARRDRLFINEANNVEFEAFEQLEVRTKEFVFLDWNPSNEFWWYSQVKPNRTDWDELTLTYKDNEALDENIVRSIEQRKNRKGWWQVYGLGKLGEVEGKIYTNWQIIPEIPHEARLERYGLDFGYTNDPTAIVAIYYYNGGYILDEILYAKGMSNKQIADTLNDNPKALVVADSAEPKSIDEIKAFQVNITPTFKGRDSVRNGIQMVQGEKISVTSRSVNLISEYRNYLWKTDRNGVFITPNMPETDNDHAMDALRYGMVSIIKKKRRPEWVSNFPDQRPLNPAL